MGNLASLPSVFNPPYMNYRFGLYGFPPPEYLDHPSMTFQKISTPYKYRVFHTMYIYIYTYTYVVGCLSNLPASKLFSNGGQYF